MNYPKVSIIVVNWNDKSNTIECIDSIASLDYPNYDIIVVDNGSTDGSQKTVKEKFPNIILIENNKNLGYGGGANAGIEVAIKKGSDYVFPLNNDLIVDKNLLKELIAVAESDASIGMVCPKIYWYDDPRKICYVGAQINFRSVIQLHRHMGDEIERGQYNRPMYVDAAGIFLVKKEVVEKVGVFDPNYFLYLEDFDWCIRTRKAGYKIMYVPDAVMWHKGSVSAGGRLRSKPIYYNTRNRFLLWKKNLKKSQFLLFLICFFNITVPIRTVYYLIILHKWKHLKAFLKGVIDGLKIL